MPLYTESVERLIRELCNLPGVGKKTAERYAFHLLRSSPETVFGLADALRDVKTKIGVCSTCYQMTENDPCAICADPRRDTSSLCVVEQPKDVVAIEKTGSFRGLYHVLLGRISPLDGTAPEDLTIEALILRVRNAPFKEIILATNPNLEGEGTALYISQELAKLDKPLTITRLARGMPSGAAIEFASPEVLSDAFSGRRELKPSPPE